MPRAAEFCTTELNPVQELSGSTITANLLTGLGVDEVFTRTDSAGARSFLADALGSTIGLTDANGAVKTQYTYGAFGATTATGAASTNSFEFTGRENDGTGLYYYRARTYDPQISRFISEDPARLWGGSTNFYAYANNNPISYSDPFGLQSTSGRGSCQPKCFAQLKFRPVQDWRAKLLELRIRFGTCRAAAACSTSSLVDPGLQMAVIKIWMYGRTRTSTTGLTTFLPRRGGIAAFHPTTVAEWML
jgi:RHS repeat-associated protein